MRVRVAAGLTLASFVALGSLLSAQDADRVIPGGGVFVPGWTGKIDAGSARQGRVLNDAKFVKEGDALHVTTGPATTLESGEYGDRRLHGAGDVP